MTKLFRKSKNYFKKGTYEIFVKKKKKTVSYFY